MARHRPRGLEVRMLTAMAVLGLISAGIGWTLHWLGLPGWAVAALAALVLAGQWVGTERLALAATAAREVGPERAPALHQAMDRLCALTGQPKPRLALSMAPEPNAFTVGRSRRHATIVVTEALCRRLDQRELEAALAHELAHIQHRDVAVMTIASSFALALAWLVRMIGRAVMVVADAGGLDLEALPVLAVVVAGIAAVTLATAIAHLPLRALSRYRELAADRTAAVQLGQPALLASVLVKVHGERDRLPRADLRARGVPAIGLVARPTRWGPWFSTHPTLARRLRQLVPPVQTSARSTYTGDLTS
jgi:heat shock protein HtpX